MNARVLKDSFPALDGGAAPSLLNRLRTKLNLEGVVAVAIVIAAWQLASGFLPAFLFPPLQKIFATLLGILSTPEELGTAALTCVRILSALLVTFTVATLLGIWAGVSSHVDRALNPIIQMKQGVPGVCWAIFAVIWFESTELRIFFVVFISILPSFFFQARDGFRGIPRELWEMVRSLRPSRWQTLRVLVLPALAPAMITGWRINLGNGARVAVTAELLAGISGIGHQLRTAQEQFRMDTALAWTVLLAVFILLSDHGMARLERRVLRWRQLSRETP